MREEGIERLNSIHIKRNSPEYIVMHFLVADLKEAVSQYGKGKVLDIGCGNKPYEQLFVQNASYTGCDMVQSSMQKVDVLCPATDLLFEEHVFDTVFSTQVMEHVEDPEKMVKESFRVLKPGGTAIFSIPLCWQLHEEPYDFFRFTKYGLKALFERNGYQVIYIKPNGGKWAAIMQMNINIIYSTFRRKSWWIKPVKLLFLHLHFTALLNSLGLWLDKRFFDEVLTLNYVIVAKK